MEWLPTQISPIKRFITNTNITLIYGKQTMNASKQIEQTPNTGANITLVYLKCDAYQLTPIYSMINGLAPNITLVYHKCDAYQLTPIYSMI